MLGYVEHREALIWVEVTTETNKVEIRYRKKGGTEWLTKKYAGELHKTFNPVKVELEALDPSTEYEYQVALDGNVVKFDYPLTFKTRILWEYRKADYPHAPDFTFLFGSCAYINDEPFDRKDSPPYGQDYNIFEQMAKQPSDLMMWLGDNMYLREVDYSSRYGIWYRNSQTRRIPQLQKLLASRPNVAIYDDHDFGPNDSDGSYELKDESLNAFKNYWGNKTYGVPGTPGCFGRFAQSDAEFFMVDNRYYRTSDDLKDEDPSKSYLGRKQLDWLKAALMNSSQNRMVKFRFIAVGNQVLNPINPYECYRHYTKEYNELIDFIVKNKINGVIFLSGDRHLSEIIKVQPEGFYPLHDVTSSPFTSHPAVLPDTSKEFTNPYRVPNTLLMEQNYIKVTLSGGGKDAQNKESDRVVTFTAYNKDNQQKWEYSIKAGDLKAPK